MTERYEVIVCGGGMVGAAAACALAHVVSRLRCWSGLTRSDSGRRNLSIFASLR